IQNTKVVMYIAHICGVRLPAAPMPTQICQVQAATPHARVRATRHIQAKYLSPGIPMVRMTSRLTSAQVACVAAAFGAGSVLMPCGPPRACRVGSRLAPDDLLEVG